MVSEQDIADLNNVQLAQYYSWSSWFSSGWIGTIVMESAEHVTVCFIEARIVWAQDSQRDW